MVPPPPPVDLDNLSDGSDLTGDEEPLESDAGPEMDDDNDDVSVSRTPSKNRRRIVEDDENDEDAEGEEDEDDGEMEDEEDDDDEGAEGEEEEEEDDDDDNVDAEEMQDDDDESDDEFKDELAEDAEVTRPTKGTARSRAAARSAAAAASVPTTTPTKKAGGTSLKVTLRRSPSSVRKAAAASSKGASSTPSKSSTPKTRSISKVKWKARPSRGGGKDDDDEGPDLDIDGSASPSLSALGAGDDGEPMSGTEDGLDELDGVPGSSRRATDSPMIAKTARQLAKENKDLEAGLLELPMTDESRKRKLTENEIALRRSEVARKRKNQSEKKLEDDKIETINRLLKKQVGRSRGKRAVSAGQDSEGDDDDAAGGAGGKTSSGGADGKGKGGALSRQAIKERPAPLFRYINTVGGSVLAVPTSPAVGDVMPAYTVAASRALIQELEASLPPSPPPSSAGESTTRGPNDDDDEKHPRARLQRAKAGVEEEEQLEEKWGQEGAYELVLRRAMGVSRRDWIGSRKGAADEVADGADEAEKAAGSGEGEDASVAEEQQQKTADGDVEMEAA